LRIYPNPLLFGAIALPMFPSECRGEVNHEKLESWGLLFGENCVSSIEDTQPRYSVFSERQHIL